MYLVGVRITFRLFESFSLKDKRRIVKSIIQRVQTKYRISASEVDLQEMLNQAVVGIGTVSGNLSVAEHLLEEVIRYIEAHYEIDITDVDWGHTKV